MKIDPSKKTIRVTLVDDQLLFRKGMRAILNSTTDIETLFEAENGKDLLEKLKSHVPEVILLDLEMPVMNGIETLRILLKDYPAIRTIVLTVHNEPGYIARIIELGANGFLQKNIEPEAMIHTIRKVVELGFFLDETTMLSMHQGMAQARRTSYNNLPEILTKREKEVLLLICKQYTTPEIARELFLSERTVDGHRNNILAKTDSKNIAGAVIYAITSGLFNPMEGGPVPNTSVPPHNY